MRNCLILGCPRSGTSLVTGILAGSGYFMGDETLAASDANPKGYFEDREMNRINEEILASALPRRPEWFTRPWRLRKLLFHHIPRDGQRWLAVLPLNARLKSGPEIDGRIRSLTARQPFCFKDPRLSYTLPIWQPFLHNTVFVCVFRDPATTAESILKECSRDEFWRDLNMSPRRAFKVWIAMYRHILEIHRRSGRWLFLHYEQAMSPEGRQRLSEFLSSPVDANFADAALRRSRPRCPAPLSARRIFEQLCALAGFSSAAI